MNQNTKFTYKKETRIKNSYRGRNEKKISSVYKGYVNLALRGENRGHNGIECTSTSLGVCVKCKPEKNVRPVGKSDPE
jgi:hypothetical protein